MISFFRRIGKGSFYSKLLLLLAPLVAAPLLTIPFYPQDARYAYAFIIPAAASACFGIIAAYTAKQGGEEQSTGWISPLRRAGIPVMFTWSTAILAGAVPFIVSGELGFVRALFESVSGWSTAGLTVADVTRMPHIFLFHRAFMQYCGGLGFIIFAAILVQGRQMVNVYTAEGHPDGILPNLRRSSQAMLMLYLGSLLAGSVVYTLLGMPLFESICHTMSAVSTAGFTTRGASIGEYNSLPIELFTIVLMLIGSTNFAVLLLLVRGRFKRAFQTAEVRVLLVTLAVFIPIITLSLVFIGGLRFFPALRETSFGVISLFTTTGYSTADYWNWPAFTIGVSFLLMILGGSTGSTAGGIKFLRAYVLFRVSKSNLHGRLSPAHNVTVLRYKRPQGEAPIDNRLIFDTMEFIAVYMLVLVIGTLLLTITADCGLLEALYEFTSALGTVGISNGITGGGNAGTLIVLMFGMILGRLEIYVVLISLVSFLNKSRQSVVGLIKNRKQ